MKVCDSGHRKVSVVCCLYLTGVRIKQVNFRENICAFHQDKENCPLRYIWVCTCVY